MISLDESWVWEGMGPMRGWSIPGLNPEAAVEAGYMPCFPESPAHGKRAILITALSDEGVIPESTETFTGGSDETGDYHKTFRASMFEEYFEELLQKVASYTEKNTIVFMLDNASYHKRSRFAKKYKKPNRKADYLEILNAFGVETKKATVKVLKEKMQELIEQEQLDMPVVEYLCNSYSEALQKKFVILWLPPYHSFFNPIEMLWKDLKDYLRNSRPIDAKLIWYTERTKIFCENFSTEKAKKLFGHVEKEENKFKDFEYEFPIEVKIFI